LKTQRKFLVPTADAPFALVIDAGRDPESRAVAFNLLADQAKADIHRLANGRWEAAIAIPSSGASSNEIRVYARSRRDLESSIDRLIGGFIDPKLARQLYAYLASLRRRGELGGLEITGDMISPDGLITNIDARSAEIH
jgi:hypothetical protein